YRQRIPGRLPGAFPGGRRREPLAGKNQRAIAERRALHRLAGTVPGCHCVTATVTGNGWPDPDSKIHRPLSGVQIRALRGILLDWHAPEHLDGAPRRSASGEAYFRPGAILGIRCAAPVLASLARGNLSRAAWPLLESPHDRFPGFPAL